MPTFRPMPIVFITLVGIRLMSLPINRYVPRRLVNYFVRRYVRDRVTPSRKVYFICIWSTLAHVGASMVKNMLVTGGAGFMGSWLVDELISRGHNVSSVDDMSGGYMRNVSKDCSFTRGDLRDRALVNRLVKGVDIIYHLAAYAAEGQSVFSPIAINDINITPMNNLLVAAVNNGVERLVFTSSMAVYGSQQAPFSEEMPRRPEDPYGAGKAYCESMLEIFRSAHGLDYAIIRPHNIYGPRQNIADPFRNVLGIWINRIMKNKPPIVYGTGNQIRAFSYIDETTKAIARAGLAAGARNQIINVGSPESVSINDACSTLLTLMSSEQTPEHVAGRPQEVEIAYCTTEKSERLLDYRNMHTLEQGLGEMILWAREIGPQQPSYRLPLEITKSAPKVWVDQTM